MGKFRGGRKIYFLALIYKKCYSSGSCVTQIGQKVSLKLLIDGIFIRHMTSHEGEKVHIHSNEAFLTVCSISQAIFIFKYCGIC